MKTVLVTGASGFCGTHLARRLRDHDAMRLVGAAHREPAALHRHLWDDFVVMDIRDAGGVQAVVRSQHPDSVFHLAGQTTGRWDDIHATNAEGTRHVLAALQLHAPDAALLVVGSAAEYGAVVEADLPIDEGHPCTPRGAYGMSKHVATLAALEAADRAGTRIVVVRPFNVVGADVPSDLVVGALIQRLKRIAAGEEDVLRVGRLDTRRDFLAVEDLVDAYVRIMHGECWGEVINLCSGIPTAIRTVVECLVRLAACRVRVETDPALVRPDDVLVSFGSPEKARRLFGFTPTMSLEQSLEAAWFAAAAAPAR